MTEKNYTNDGRKNYPNPAFTIIDNFCKVKICFGDFLAKVLP